MGNHAHPVTEQRRKLYSLMASAHQAGARLQPLPRPEFEVALNKGGDVNKWRVYVFCVVSVWCEIWFEVVVD